MSYRRFFEHVVCAGHPNPKMRLYDVPRDAERVFKGVSLIFHRTLRGAIID